MDLDTIKEEYETGLKVLEQLFKLSDIDLKEKLKSILGNSVDEKNDGLLGKDSDGNILVHSNLQPHIINDGNLQRVILIDTYPILNIHKLSKCQK